MYQIAEQVFFNFLFAITLFATATKNNIACTCKRHLSQTNVDEVVCTSVHCGVFRCWLHVRNTWRTG